MRGTIDNSVETIFELGGVTRVGELLAELGCTRVLVVTGPSRRFLDRALPSLQGLEHRVFDGARVHVPRAVVDAAEQAARELGADGVLTLGGGAATGLGKALRLRMELAFVAVPTTYSGSEGTAIWGMTDGRDKRTGRDARVRPDRILYDAELLVALPARVAVQSTLNALAHPLSALSTGTLTADAEAEALAVAGELVTAAQGIAAAPDDVTVRQRALRAAAGAARVLDAGTLGVHHGLAHLLGGRFGLEHAALHSVLLPSTLAALLNDGELGARVAAALGGSEVPATLRAVLRAVGAEVTLRELGVDVEAALEAVRERELGEAAEAVLWGALGM